MKTFVIFLAALALVIGFASPALAQDKPKPQVVQTVLPPQDVVPAVAVVPPADPQLLIRKYDGSWTVKVWSGSAELDILEVNSGEVKGRVIYYGSGGATANRWWDFTGKLDGLTLKFVVAGNITFHLVVNPDDGTITGSTSGAMSNGSFDFVPKKAKARR